VKSNVNAKEEVSTKTIISSDVKNYDINFDLAL